MNTMGFQQASPTSRPETEAARLARVAREKAIIAKAESDIDDGFGINDDDREEWLDALDQDETTPIPSPRNGPAIR